jgi:hypothetical protein
VCDELHGASKPNVVSSFSVAGFGRMRYIRQRPITVFQPWVALILFPVIRSHKTTLESAPALEQDEPAAMGVPILTVFQGTTQDTPPLDR